MTEEQPKKVEVKSNDAGVKTMSWKTAFLCREHIRFFQKRCYPDTPKELMESIRRFYMVGTIYISILCFFLGYVLGRV